MEGVGTTEDMKKKARMKSAADPAMMSVSDHSARMCFLLLDSFKFCLYFCHVFHLFWRDCRMGLTIMAVVYHRFC